MAKKPAAKKKPTKPDVSENEDAKGADVGSTDTTEAKAAKEKAADKKETPPENEEVPDIKIVKPPVDSTDEPADGKALKSPVDSTDEPKADAPPEAEAVDDATRTVTPEYTRNVKFPKRIRIPAATAAAVGTNRILIISNPDQALPALAVNWLKSDSRYKGMFVDPEVDS